MRNLMFKCLIIGCFIVPIIFCGCKDKSIATEQIPLQLSDSLLQMINISEVELREVNDILNLSGKVTFERENIVEVMSLLGGNVVEVRAELGDYVKKGDILAVIKSSEVADFQHQEKEAELNLLLAQKNYDVAKDLSQSGISSDRDLLASQAELENAKAQSNKIKEILSIYNIRNNSEYVIKSPISGFIVEKNISREMQLRADNDKEIFTISKLDDVWVLANVYETEISKIKENSRVEIIFPAYPDLKFDTKIEKVYNVLDIESNTLTIRMKLKNADYLLKPGMFSKVYVHCNMKDEKLPSIDEKALIFDKNKYFCIVNNGNEFEIREIVPFNIGGAYISIKKGLEIGEKVVSKNALLIYDALLNR